MDVLFNLSKVLPFVVIKRETPQDIYTLPVLKVGNKYLISKDIYPGEASLFLSHMNPETWEYMRKKVIPESEVISKFPCLCMGGCQN